MSRKFNPECEDCQRERRERNKFLVIRDWQRFCFRLAGIFKCPAIDTDVQKKAREVVKENRRLRRELRSRRP
jgi:hypothetical protein